VAVYLVRHAKAGDRDPGDDDDHLRPLTKSGHEQAQALVERLEQYPIRRILSSPYVRCIQTVEPLAKRLGLRVETTDELAEGSGSQGVRRLIASLHGTDAVLCSHGDVVQELVEELVAQRLIKPSQATRLAKGSTWVLDERDGRVTGARYLDAP
jgi:phosphohistidine phosphatase SixA